MPKTVLGKWSVGLIVVFFLSLALLLLFILFNQRGGETFFSNPILAIPVFLMGISGVTGFFAGIFSIIESKERAVLVFLSTAVGFLVLLFAIGEILLPCQ